MQQWFAAEPGHIEARRVAGTDLGLHVGDDRVQLSIVDEAVGVFGFEAVLTPQIAGHRRRDRERKHIVGTDPLVVGDDLGHLVGAVIDQKTGVGHPPGRFDVDGFTLQKLVDGRVDRGDDTRPCVGVDHGAVGIDGADVVARWRQHWMATAVSMIRSPNVASIPSLSVSATGCDRSSPWRVSIARTAPSSSWSARQR